LNASKAISATDLDVSHSKQNKENIKEITKDISPEKIYKNNISQ
jgi:hypothetical protein